jgi:drug/metabolite transporter (DMT)-like permease
MFSIALAATSALIWGAGDFTGGKASRRASALSVTVLSQVLSLPLLLIAVFLVPYSRVSPADVAWGAAAGVAGFLGILLLYRGLAAGSMAIFSPVSAVTAAVIPLVIGLFSDDLPTTPGLVGAVCAVIAIALVSMSPSRNADRRRVSSGLIGLALASGAMFGIFFALLGQASGEAGMWPMLAVRFGSIGFGLILVLRGGTSLRLGGRSLRMTALAGALDITANGLYLRAVVDGPMSIIAPIAALYPASTVLLALAVDRERLRPIQMAGLGLAAAALVLAASPA